MNSLLSVGLGQASCGLALVLIGAAAACSSSSSGPGSEGPSDSSTATQGDSSMAAPSDAGNGGPSGDGGTFNGTGAPCPPLTDEWLGALLTLNVTWLPVIAANGSPTSGPVPPIYIWSLYHYTFNGTAITGTSRTCGDQLPPLTLNDTGKMAINLKMGGPTVQVLNETPTTKTWDNDTRTAQTTGTLGGWNIGSSLAMTLTTSVSGLAPASMFANPTTPWPPSATTFMTSDFSDDDHDGNPGITAFPLEDHSAGYYLPATSLGGSTGNGSMPTLLADKLYIVSRTQISLSGTSTSCSEIKGTLTSPEYVVHVIGCHDQGTAASATCMPGEWQFIDENATIYAGAGGAKSPIAGTFDAKQLTAADGGEPGCDDVVAAFPSPMPQPQGDP